MRIFLSPQRRDDLLEVSKAGDVLTINGEAFDFASLPDGATIQAGAIPCDFITGPVHRIDGDLHLTLILPHGPHPEQWQAFPEDLISPPDGELDLPVDTVIEEIDEIVEPSEAYPYGAVRYVTIWHRWGREDERAENTVPNPEPETEEPANVDA